MACRCGPTVLSQAVEAQVHNVSKTAQVLRPSSTFEEQAYRVLDERVEGVEVNESQHDTEVDNGVGELALYLDSSEEDFIPPSPSVVSPLHQFRPAVRASGDLVLRGELRNLRGRNVDAVENLPVSNNVFLLEGNEIGSRPVNSPGFLVVGNDGLSGEAYGLQESWMDNIRLDMEEGVPGAGRSNARGEEAGAERSQQLMANTEPRTPGFQNREKVTAASQGDQSAAAQDLRTGNEGSGAVDLNVGVGKVGVNVDPLSITVVVGLRDLLAKLEGAKVSGGVANSWVPPGSAPQNGSLGSSDKDDIMKHARQKKDLSHAGHKIQIFTDLSPATLQKRRDLSYITTTLRH
ncbi:uncharacterized protein LOC128639028 [Bombina bombina]|uniref:uncharacterized protein LOC128639028 n=1 Tax=Bombina bombina TaxID=8345 RepID=UPI00235A9ED6|nr:uncharacterized protein LOC128639028 [Bombina bombina]